MHETAPSHVPSVSGTPSSGKVPPEVHYVIIGRGFSAVLNHVTLRLSEEGRERLGNLPVMHIGFEDPWSYYRRHQMGQFPHLLALPGFSAGTDDDSKEYQDSTRFAEATRREFELLAEKYTVVTKEGWVAIIQPHNSSHRLPDVLRKLSGMGMKQAQLEPLLEEFDDPSHPPYRLLVIDSGGKPEIVYAQKVDICTGPGVPRLLNPETMSSDLYAAYQGKPWIPLEKRTGFRHVLCGHDALYRTSLWPERPQICVHGTGGVALNVVETALEARKQIDWTAEKTHDDVFSRPGRNRSLLQDGSTIGAWKPSHVLLRLGEHIQVQTLKLEALEKVDVRFAGSAAGIPPQMTDVLSNHVTLQDGRFPPFSFFAPQSTPGSSYAQLVVARGFVADDRDLPGTAAFLASLVEKTEGLSAIVSADGRWIGLKSGSETGQGPVRILGVAAITYPEDALNAIPKFEAHRDLALQYMATLPLQAQGVGLAGITYNAMSIALANYFTGSTLNANTASGEELINTLGKSLGNRVLKAREQSQHGFRNLYELLAVLAGTGELPLDLLEELLDLSFDYL